jgi:hypothetical protein
LITGAYFERFQTSSVCLSISIVGSHAYLVFCSLQVVVANLSVSSDHIPFANFGLVVTVGFVLWENQARSFFLSFYCLCSHLLNQ